MQRISEKYHWGANWGWIACRDAVMKEAVRRFTMGHDEAAQLLRSVASSQLVIRPGTLKDAPAEHCASGCDMHGGVFSG